MSTKANLIVATTSVLISVLLAAVIWEVLKVPPEDKPIDLQMVQLDERVPDFYWNVFRPNDQQAVDMLVNDPVVHVRGKPFFPALHAVGPHDVLGFRNPFTPRAAELVVIGDSQTYGNNALWHESWPAQLETELGLNRGNLYSMATGGWSLPQYLSMISKAVRFQPKAILIAIYTGNDPLETFRLVYSSSVWKRLRTDSEVNLKMIPKAPPVTEDIYSVILPDIGEVKFTPGRRFLSNDRESKVVQVGYAIIDKILGEIDNFAANSGIDVFVTIIPTKEYIYSPLLEKHIKDINPVFQHLVRDERGWIEYLQGRIEELPELEFLELHSALRSASGKVELLYPTNENGHPYPPGYNLIAQVLASKLKGRFPRLKDGVYRAKQYGEDQLYLFREGKLYWIQGMNTFEGNGWQVSDLKDVSSRELSNYTISGRINAVNKNDFGPKS